MKSAEASDLSKLCESILSGLLGIGYETIPLFSRILDTWIEGQADIWIMHLFIC